MTLSLVGERFGKLVVASLASTGRQGRVWRCLCDCGGSKDILGGSLRSGRTASCGCSYRESAKRMGDANKRHGMTHETEHTIWTTMRARCNNPKSNSYYLYGARGIKVCERWDNSFDAFYEDMGPRPPGKSLDRIDGAKGYSPNNCRWATGTEQGRNKSTAKLITIDGKTQCVAAWLEEFGRSEPTFYNRLRRGWTEQDAMTTPPDAVKSRRRFKQALDYVEV